MPNCYSLLNLCSYFRALACLLIAKKRTSTSNDKQRHLLANVKNAISASAKRFSGYEQHVRELVFVGVNEDDVMQIFRDRLSMHPANERWRYIVTSFPIGRAHTQKGTVNRHPILFTHEGQIWGVLWSLAATKQLYKWYFPSVCHTFFTMFPSSYNHELLPMTKVRSMQKVMVKGQGHKGQNQT